ncbi:hypothetical protein N7548_01505 [Acholeplasma manati]|uniref:Protein kinase domain-containing protein n=1 Tax=Paracholeplasma manati TaxID=591373 RepID=A0ABT2Y446_9MOLU|nr:hypothetical protein [Paracholeplasma manati]MCV2231504.1 hypothetical protein [Paracholeplasma manati]
MLFNIAQKVKLENGEFAIIKKFLGEGGQGEVYLVSQGSRDYALKWYKMLPSESFINNLRNNIHLGQPSNDFLWPLRLTEKSNQGVGYLMDLRPSIFKDFIAFLNAKVKFSSHSALVTYCLNLTNAFKQLHQRGYSYQDLNDGSFFFNPDNGDALICDNDNVAKYGTNLGIMGKMKYMAPEVVVKKNLPDTHTDRFSLAVILFMTLTYGHPFQGELLRNYPMIDEAAEYELYGASPIFVFDPNNTSNRPIRGYHNAVLKLWPELPNYVKQEFIKTFTEGLLDRENGRTTELKWVKTFQKYRDEIVKCPKCNFEYPAQTYPKSTCPKCKLNHEILGKLTINNHLIYLDSNKEIYQTHIDKTSSEYGKVVGRVVENKNNPNLKGFKNQSDREWKITDINGMSKIIPPEGVFRLDIKQLTIDFGEGITGEFQSI